MSGESVSQNDRPNRDGLACAGGCGRRLVGLDDSDGIARGFTCQACGDGAAAYTITDPSFLTARMPEWVTDAGGGDEDALRILLMREAQLTGVPFDEERAAERVAVMMAALEGVSLPSGQLVATPRPRCQVCGERGCEREECRLEPCPWCGSGVETGGADTWIDCSNAECGAAGPSRPTMPEAVAAWNELARNHRDAPGLRGRVAELEAEVQRLRAMLGEGWRDGEREQARRAREMEG